MSESSSVATPFETLAVVRAQTTPYENLPPATGSPFPFGGGLFQSPLIADPFLNPGGPQLGTPSRGFMYGRSSQQPLRFGWTVNGDVAYLDEESTGGGLGDFGIGEANIKMRHALPLPPSGVFSFIPKVNARFWDGPSGIGLPPDVYRMGAAFEILSPPMGGWQLLLSFFPSFGTDFDQNLTSDAWMWDGHGILYFDHSPYLTWAFGAGFWDRVNDKVIPYAGFIFRPSPQWEFRMVAPKPRISFVVADWGGMKQTIYVSGEYHIEAYEVTLQPAATREQIEIEDWRVMLGIQTEMAWVSSFIEAGWVFDRQVEFRGVTPEFTINDGFIARAGLRF